MRWSLVLSAFFTVQSALSFVCVALAIPPQSDVLERRASVGHFRLPSKKTREISKSHPHAYHVGLGPNGKMKKETLPVSSKARYKYGNGKLKTKGLHADHVFEVQMLIDHLGKNNIQLNQMNPKIKDEAKNILNSPENLAIIPGSINSSKGQLIKHAMQGKPIKGNKDRDDYVLKSYPTAHKTAGRLETVLKKHPRYAPTVTLQEKLHDTIKSAGLTPPTLRGPSSPNRGTTNKPPLQASRWNSVLRNRNPGLSNQSNPGPSSPNRGTTNKRPRQASLGTTNSPTKKKPRLGGG